MKTISIEVTKEELNMLMNATHKYVRNLKHERFEVAELNRRKDNPESEEELLAPYKAREQRAIELSSDMYDLWRQFNEQMD